MTPDQLKEKIISHSLENDIPLLEATVEVADEIGVDLEDIAVHVSGVLKERMQVECEAVGLLKKENETTVIV